MRRILVATGIVLTMLLGAAAAQAKPTEGRPPAPPGAARIGAGADAKGGPARALASAAPVYNNYLVCIGDYVYTDWYDPDGDDARLNVIAWSWRPGVGWNASWMLNTGASAHGVFFWLNTADLGISRASVTEWWFAAYDQTGTWSGWVVANGACNRIA